MKFKDYLSEGKKLKVGDKVIFDPTNLEDVKKSMNDGDDYYGSDYYPTKFKGKIINIGKTMIKLQRLDGKIPKTVSVPIGGVKK